MKSSMSLPEVKTPGCPLMSTARTALSSRAAFSASAIAWYIATVSAFFLSGRAISIDATPFSTPVRMLMPGSRSDAFDDARRALPHADAHRDHAVLQVVPAQRVHDGGGADRTGGAQRVAERDRTAHRVDLGGVQLERVDHRQRLRGERLVQLDPADVADLQPGVAQRRGDGLDRADAHDLRRHAPRGEADEARQRLQVVLLDGFLAGQDQRAGAVARLRAVAGRDAALARQTPAAAWPAPSSEVSGRGPSSRRTVRVLMSTSPVARSGSRSTTSIGVISSANSPAACAASALLVRLPARRRPALRG